MSRWQAVVVAVAAFVVLGPAGKSRGTICHRWRTSCAVEAPVAESGVAEDWSSGYAVDFGFAAAPPQAKAVTQPTHPNTGTRPTTPTVQMPTTPAIPARLHVLLLVDDGNPDSGPANKAGAALVEKTLRAGVPADRIAAVESLAGSALNPERIRNRITALGVRPQDTIVCFVSSAADADEPSRAFNFTPTAGGRFSRSELRDLLLARQVALTVLLTDAPAFRVVPEMVPPLPQEAAGPFSLTRLLFGNRGLVDVHAAAAGEVAFPRDSEGGLFTLALVDQLRQIKADGPEVTWPALMDRVRAETDRMFVDYRRAVLSSDKVSVENKRVYREQSHQTPTARSPLEQVKPAPQPAGPKAATAAATAEIVARVPAGTNLFVEGRATVQTGTVRHFETAGLQPGRDYTYTIRAELDRGGQKLTQEKKVTVRAGETKDVRFEWAE
jgi:uncharacterized protein (TIGR03000 family)